jgi:uncharacterized damage-inducible protein DinB
MSSDSQDEQQLLLHVLRRQREHVLAAVEGLDTHDLRRPVLPSGWSCLGLLNHLALDDELFWFQAVIAGDQGVVDEVLSSADNAWSVSADDSPEEVLRRYRENIESADAVITTRSLDAAPAWWPDFFGTWRLQSVREILLHVITETATHAGHLDAARELIDGRQHIVLTE